MNGYRNYRQINAIPQKRNGKDCSSALSIVPIAEANCILPPARVLMADKAITVVQSTRAIQKAASHTLSQKKTLKAIVRQRIFDVTARFIDNIMDFREMVYQQ